MGVWCEVFRPGFWNGKHFGPELVDQIIEAFGANKDQLKVPLRVGSHNELAPAGGWVTALQKVGDRLMAEFSDVPRVVGEAINRRLFKQVSIGVRHDHKDEKGKVWPTVLDHIAILGGRIPAVKGLADLPALFDDDNPQGEIITLENEEYEDMDPKLLEGQLTEAQAQNKDLRAQVTQLTAERDELKTKLAAAEKTVGDQKTQLEAKQKEAKDLQMKVTEFESAAAKAEVNAVVEAAIHAGRLVPANKDSALAAGNALRGMENFAAADSPFAAWKKGLETAPKIISYEEKAKVSAGDGNDGEQLTEFEREFAEGEKIVTERDKK